MLRRQSTQDNYIPSPSATTALSRDPPCPQANPPSHQLIFIDGQQGVRKLTAECAAKHRHAIFTENERQLMSDEVIQSVPEQDPAQALLDLERFDSSTGVTAPFSLFRGPFGVSKFPRTETETTSQDINAELLFTEDWLLDLESHDEFDLLSSILNAPDDMPNKSPETWNLFRTEEETTSHAPKLPPQLSPTSFTDNAETWPILSHYKKRIVPLIAPWGHGQDASSSWTNLAMPCAMHTLGEVTMSGSSTHARLALLNAMLSTSAFHLGKQSELCNEYWISMGDDYLQRAQSHFLRCLEEACGYPMKKSKYKEVLMAILSLSTTYMIRGDSEKSLCCLMQAEKFICANGFKQSTLSPKRRALHHCYAYMRIMAETTSVAMGLNVCLTSSTSVVDGEFADRDFRICPDIAFSDNILEMEKDPSVAQRDLHLAIPGRWSLTLFPKMYGVAESFLMLLSQVIRLANERDLSFQGGSEGTLNLKDFWVRAKALEKGIRLLLSSCISGDISSSEDESQTGIGNARAQAMYTALLIFFHRRIYDLDAAMLQQEVDVVRDSLTRIHHGEGNTAALIWPAFIAACEAVSLETQMFFSTWFDSCFAMTGLVNASVAKQIFETTWARRRELGRDGEMCSWPEVLRVKKVRLMCT